MDKDMPSMYLHFDIFERRRGKRERTEANKYIILFCFVILDYKQFKALLVFIMKECYTNLPVETMTDSLSQSILAGGFASTLHLSL